jgi:HlyD family secretion protein
MKRKWTRFLLPALAVVMLAFSVFHVVRAQQTPPKPPPPVEPPRSPFGHTIAGAGIVEPETENISIGTALPGVVLDVYVPVEKVGQRVQKGDPLFLVDNRQLQAQLAYQEANLASAEAQLAKLQAMPRPEEVPPSDAKVRVAEANVALQQDLSDRANRLIASRSMAEEDVRQRQLNLEVARMQLAQAKAENSLLKAGAWDRDKFIAQASVELARAQIRQIKTDLDRCLVRAPVDGKVLQVNVRLGEYVGTPPNQALVVLGSTEMMNVRVDIDENDIPRAQRAFQRGAPAFASPRGDPSLKYPLKFVRIEPYVIPKKSLTGDNTERVDTRVMQVIYQVQRDEPPLFVGMQMDVFLEADGGTTPESPGEKEYSTPPTANREAAMSR